MPSKIPRPCSGSSTCPHPGIYRGRCKEHATEHEADRNLDRTENVDVYRSKRWRTESRRYLRANPWCIGYRTTCHQAATDVDHVTPIGTPGVDPFDPSNWQPLCHRCHSRKTATENRRRG
jgi:5-methylcytosine-specific restriction endonuclease McrA